MARIRRLRSGGRARGPRMARAWANVSTGLQRYRILLAFLLAVSAAAVALAFSLHAFMFSSPYFQVQDIEVIDKNPQHLERALARLREPANIFSLDLTGIQARLEASYPEIQTVRVSRVLPNKLVLEVIHRRPVAQVELTARTGGERAYYTVNEDGYILALCGREPRPQLPVIVGVNLRPHEVHIGRSYERSSVTTALLLRRQLLARQLWQRYRVSRIDVTHPRNIVFFIDNRVEVRLSAADAEARLDQLADILETQTLERTGGMYIDLRFKEVVIGTL